VASRVNRQPDDPVRDQYETLPYPERDPADEVRRLITGSPSDLWELNHHVFGGGRDLSQPLRVLVAGGGTGDALVMLAQQLSDAGTPAEIHYIDVSEASRRTAEARVRARRLSNVQFHRMSLLDLPASGLGPFDYIDSCGVLHHLEDPAAGLRALVAVLADDGGMGLMVYGALGRTGVYPAQSMLRMIAAEGPVTERLSTARGLLNALPPANWLKRNPFVGDHLQGGDAGLYDLLLHARDRAYLVPEVAELAAAAGLRLVTFIEPAFYEPETFVTDPDLRRRLAGLSWLDSCALAELLTGAMKAHVCYAVQANNPVTPPDPRDPHAVPHLRGLDAKAFAAMAETGTRISGSFAGMTLKWPLPPLAPQIVARIDGRRTLADIHGGMMVAAEPVTWDAFAEQFAALATTLTGIGKLFLARGPG